MYNKEVDKHVRVKQNVGGGRGAVCSAVGSPRRVLYRTGLMNKLVNVMRLQEQKWIIVIYSHLTCLVRPKTNSGAGAHLVRFVWAGANAVTHTLMRTKQLDRDHLKRRALVHFHVDFATAVTGFL